MAIPSYSASDVQPSQAVLDWLLDSDPAIRWQVLWDLTDASDEAVAAERARVGKEGWGAEVLDLQDENGAWDGRAWNPGWDSTMHALWLLWLFGLDPASEPAQQALTLVRERVTWKGAGPPQCDGNAYFEGEIEPCINGQVAAAGAYFGQDVVGLIDRLLGEQLDDGGWNCEAENGSTRGSFNTTICVLEALLAYEQHFGQRADVTAARERGQDYLLDRKLFKRLSTGKAIVEDRMSGADWAQFSFPGWWQYDVLRGLDYLRRAGVRPDARVSEAVELVLAKRGEDGRWCYDAAYDGINMLDMGERVGEPNRWITLRALRVLRWAAG
jgi:hypothetical protein